MPRHRIMVSQVRSKLRDIGTTYLHMSTLLKKGRKWIWSGRSTPCVRGIKNQPHGSPYISLSRLQRAVHTSNGCKRFRAGSSTHTTGESSESLHTQVDGSPQRKTIIQLAIGLVIRKFHCSLRYYGSPGPNMAKQYRESY